MQENVLPKLPQSQIPESRGKRILKLGQLAGGMAGGAFTEGAKRLFTGESLNPSTLLLTPANANRLSKQLAELRGAAMKLGQMISMEAGDLLPEEFSQLLTRLREDADQMPLGQVAQVLEQNWGKDWDRQFKRFNFTPIAAASIGQVHEAITKQGRHLAIKIQYPGIRKSIESDVDNVASLLKLFRMIPEELNVNGLLVETKQQLHQEADYFQEAVNQKSYAVQLGSVTGFKLPTPVDDMTTREVLCMDFIPGVPLDQLTQHSSEIKNAVAHRLTWLSLQETFRWGMVQTDPNFANYRYDDKTEQLGLLDFGAVRYYEKTRIMAFHNLLSSLLEDDIKQVEQAAIEVGYLDPQAPELYRSAICNLLKHVAEPMRQNGSYDFANSDLMTRMSEQVIYLRLNQHYWHLPPHDVLMLHRKLAGLYLACVRLKAKVDVRALILDILS
ncbi:MAG: AarF/ABC1/UbiB kinase family protein [Candidatus Thiodiazotropha sp. 6PLUC3]